LHDSRGGMMTKEQEQALFDFVERTVLDNQNFQAAISKESNSKLFTLFDDVPIDSFDNTIQFMQDKVQHVLTRMHERLHDA